MTQTTTHTNVTRGRIPRFVATQAGKVVLAAVVALVLISAGTGTGAVAAAASPAPPPAPAPQPSLVLQRGGALLSNDHVAPEVVPLATGGKAAAPPWVDLSQWAVPVEDQKNESSCTTWAIDYAMLGWYGRKYGKGQLGTKFTPM